MRYIRRRAETGPVWSYFFNQDFTIEGGRAPWHCSDIPFVFHNTELVPSANISGVTPQLEQQIFDAVLAFARTGNPQHSGIPTPAPRNRKTPCCLIPPPAWPLTMTKP